MSNAGSLVLVAFGVLLMWLCWKDFGWFYFLIEIPRRTALGLRRKSTKEEAAWDRVVVRFIFFMVGLGLVVWQAGLMIGLWHPTTPK